MTTTRETVQASPVDGGFDRGIVFKFSGGDHIMVQWAGQRRHAQVFTSLLRKNEANPESVFAWNHAINGLQTMLVAQFEENVDLTSPRFLVALAKTFQALKQDYDLD